MPVRLAAIVVLVALAGTGCRSLGLNGASRPESILPPPSLAVTQLIERHNQNAERVQSLEATPAVSDRMIGAAHGQMAFVRPLDFRLTLSTGATGHRLADLGANGQDYWFWFSKSENKEYYVGHFDDHGEAAPGLILQPDWIVEAIGLRVIPDEELKRITTEKGDAAGTLTLVHHRPGSNGQSQIKKTIVDRQTGEVREHVFYAPDNKSILARALPSDYRLVAVPAAADSASKPTVSLPYRIKVISSPPERKRTEMDIVMGGAKINQFAADRRANLFKLPDYDRQGFARVDIDERMSRAAGEVQARGGSATIRETKPAPPAGGRVQLQAPQPIEAERQGRVYSTHPAPLAADLPDGGIEGVVRAQIPRPPATPGQDDLQLDGLAR